MVATSDRVQIRLLGEPALLVGGVPAAMRTQRIAALVGYVVAHGPRAVARGVLAAALWPDREPELAHANLRQTLLRLRQSLGECADAALDAERHGVRLRPEANDSDVAAFTEFVRQDTPASLRSAVGLYRGPFLAGFEDEWALPVRAELSRAFVKALLDLSAHHLAEDPAEALRLAERAVAEEPYHEGARAATIRALRALALRAFEAYEALLADELGLRPTRLVEEALTGESPSRPRPVPEPDDPGTGQALRALLDSGRAEDALRLATSMVPFWIEIGAYRSGLRWMEATRAAGGADPDLRSRAALGVAMLAGRVAEADRAYAEGKAAFADANDDGTRAQALLTMGYARLVRRDFRQARLLALRSLRLARRSPEPLPVTRDLWVLVGYCHHDEGRAARALRSGYRALATPRGAARALGMASLLAAFAHLHLGDGSGARRALEDGIQALGDVRSHANEYVRMTAARLREEIGEADAAEAGYLGAIETYRRSGDPWNLPVALTYLGDLKTVRNDPQAALILHREALAIREQTDDRQGAATSLRGLGLAYLALGRNAEARDALREAVRRYSEADFPGGVASTLVPLARAEAEVGSREVARRLARRAVRLLRDLGPAVCATVAPHGDRLLPEAQRLLHAFSPGGDDAEGQPHRAPAPPTTPAQERPARRPCR